VRIVVQVIKGQPARAKRGRLAWAVPALLLVGGVAGAAGVAAASVPDAAGTIHACYSTSNGALRVIDTALHQACSTSEKALNWPARSIRWRGSWTSTTAYAVDDSVGYAGGSYMALIGNAGKAPSASPTVWAVLAQLGSAGPRGPARVLSIKLLTHQRRPGAAAAAPGRGTLPRRKGGTMKRLFIPLLAAGALLLLSPARTPCLPLTAGRSPFIRTTRTAQPMACA